MSTKASRTYFTLERCTIFFFLELFNCEASYLTQRLILSKLKVEFDKKNGAQV